MKILVFTEGTLLTHQGAFGVQRNEIVNQVKNSEPSIKDYGHYIPIGGAAQKTCAWATQGAEIIYLTSRRNHKEINSIKQVLDRYGFPDGSLVYRRWFESYGRVAERIAPDILIEDDCESIGGILEMTYPQIKKAIRCRIKSIVIKEFGGIDHLPDALELL